MMGPGSAVPSSHEFFLIPASGAGPTTTHLITTTAAAVRLSSFVRHRLRLQLPLPSFSFKSHLGHLLPSLHLWHESALPLTGLNILQLSYNAISSKCMNLYFFKGNEDKNNSSDLGKASRRTSVNRRKWTNILLAVNIAVYVAQFATQGRLLLWGAKINGLIDKGQLWRLITSSLLHANIGHLMVNCYSLNSIGPAVENISGPKRFLAIYMTSAIASSAMSYYLCKAPAVGASGAIFGLVGSFAVFILRHRDIIKGSEQDLQHVMRVIVLNMVIGILSRGIDNWGHLGGLLGGAATSWLLGPAWKLESNLGDKGHKVFADRAPIFSVMKIGRTRK